MRRNGSNCLRACSVFDRIMDKSNGQKKWRPKPPIKTAPPACGDNPQTGLE
jgi:hypothetical protein